MSALIGSGVNVQTSKLENAGNGLFAGKSFVRNEFITHYDGDVIDRKTAERLRQLNSHGHVCVLHFGFLYIDGLKEPLMGRGGGSFANDPKDPDRYNAKFYYRYDNHTGQTIIYLKATKDIQEGQEIYVSYGRTFWKTRTI